MTEQDADPSPREFPIADADLPEQVGRYTFGGLIARGGMGAVYRAHDPTLNRSVAIKLIFSDGAAPRLVARLQREAELAASLSHPSIINIHEVGKSGPDPGPGRSFHYIVMDLIEGPTLADTIKTTPQDQNLRTLIQIVEAVAHAHQRGVLHRDLKPDNVLLAENGRPVVTDFGLARAIETQERLTQSHEVLGTPHYMAPEQILALPVGPQTDVWALGVILYEMLFAGRPFEGQGQGELYNRILSEEPGASGSGDARLEAIALKALSKQREQRYADASAMLADLHCWRSGEAVSAASQSWSSRVGIGARRHPWWSLVVCLIAVLCIGLAARETQRRSEVRRFDQLRRRAMAAYRAGNWAEARGQIEGALAIREDAELTRLSRLCRDRLRDDARVGQSRQRRADSALALQLETQQARRKIEETRAYFHRREADIAAKLKVLRRTLSLLDRLAREQPDAGRETWWLLGKGWFYAGDQERAEAALRQVLRVNSADSAARFLLGRLALERWFAYQFASGPLLQQKTSRRLLRRAADCFKRAFAGGRQVQPIDRALIKVYRLLADRDWSELRRLCVQGARTYQGRLGVEQFWMLQGWTQRGHPRLACWNRALEIRPHDAWLRYLRGSQLNSMKRYAEAIEDFDKVVVLKPRFSHAFNNRGLARAGLGDHKHALEDYGRALALDPEQAFALNNRALSWIQLKQYQRARDDLEQAIRLRPRVARLHLNHGIAWAEEGKLEAALRDYQRAITLDPRDASAYFNRGAAWSSRGDDRRAIVDYTRALDRRPAYVKALVNRGLARHNTRDFSGALTDYRKALALQKDALTYANRGNTRMALGDRPGALSDYSEAIRRDPRQHVAWVGRGTIYLQQGKLVLARSDLDRAIALAPDSAQAYINRAEVRNKSGDLPGAFADLGRAIKIVPRKMSAHFNRGVLYQLSGRHAEAARDFSMVTQIEPKFWQGWGRYGLMLGQLGRKREALAALSKALKLAPAKWRSQIVKQMNRLR